MGHANAQNGDYRDLFIRILQFANRNLPVFDFLKEVSREILDLTKCDEVELRLREGKKFYRCISSAGPDPVFAFDLLPCVMDVPDSPIPCLANDTEVERACREAVLECEGLLTPFPVHHGRILGGDFHVATVTATGIEGETFRSIAVIPICADNRNLGLLLVKNRESSSEPKNRMTTYESAAATLSIAIAHQRALLALRERVKELTCLYGIANVTGKSGASLDDILQGIVSLLPEAWQYPEITSAKISFGDKVFSTPGFRESGDRQAAEIVIASRAVGSVEVFYWEKRPQRSEGPFLAEERSLIDAVAWQAGLAIEQKLADEDRLKLETQLRHADRLATIGQLAAGVAHELNEPLGGILGFAQLARKAPGLSKQAEWDMERIVNASLHAREIVRKLLIFSRQAPSKREEIDVNDVIEATINILEHRFRKDGISVIRELAPELPRIDADRAQLIQIVVNLSVNAAQALSKSGGRIVMRTRADDGKVILEIEDNGCGMSEEVRKKVFLPFFTTKDVNQGTGLGLSVVHGIVTSHGGRIDVRSEEGRGTCFSITLPIKQETGVEASVENGG